MTEPIIWSQIARQLRNQKNQNLRTNININLKKNIIAQSARGKSQACVVLRDIGFLFDRVTDKDRCAAAAIINEIKSDAEFDGLELNYRESSNSIDLCANW